MPTIALVGFRFIVAAVAMLCGGDCVIGDGGAASSPPLATAVAELRIDDGGAALSPPAALVGAGVIFMEDAAADFSFNTFSRCFRPFTCAVHIF